MTITALLDVVRKALRTMSQDTLILGGPQPYLACLLKPFPALVCICTQGMLRVGEIFQRDKLRDDTHLSLVYEQRLFFFYMPIRKLFPVGNRDRAPWSSSQSGSELLMRYVGGGSCYRSRTGSSGVLSIVPESSTMIVEMIAVLADLRTAC